MTVQAELVATLVDEWVRAGVRHAVVAPGSRSAPLALALLDRASPAEALPGEASPGEASPEEASPEEALLGVTVRLDERSAAFTCLGIALATGRPAVLVTTSGTAAAEAHAAVVEADLAGVPMIVVTADRPAELLGVGAPQTIDQRDLFGRAVRSFVDLGGVCSGEPAARAAWRSLASRIVLDATAGPSGPGPVHVNLPLREPLLQRAGSLPPGRPGGAPWHGGIGPGGIGPGGIRLGGTPASGAPAGGEGAAASPTAAAQALLRIVAGAGRGLIVAGGGAGGRGVLTLARQLGWPVLADPRAWPRVPDELVVAHADQVLRSERARAELAPEVVVHLGAPHASKVLATWWGEPALGAARHVVVEPFGRAADPERRADLVLGGDPDELCAVAAAQLGTAPPHGAGYAVPAGGAGYAAPPPEVGYAALWRRVDDAAEAAIAGVLEGYERRRCLTEPAVARQLFAALPEGSVLVAASSMPVRDLEWFTAPRNGAPLVLANRGANGIDGVISTAVGVALARRRRSAAGPTQTAALVGDLAFLHDLTALLRGRLERLPDLVLVVVDNGGGGIFSFLPYAGALPEERFERAFGTPQAADPAALARALGAGVTEVDDPAGLAPAIRRAALRGGLEVLVARTGRAANVAVHAELAEASAVAVEAPLAPGSAG
ncbi:MAG TPA: 2-succinyl-5-enolpyruvyl-6-hydroxy-3-cyclohexene-1-carboxylic-acid synthase [Acidimicrobiales bacterium]|nr:2-succinyl-5-enolpyruvyl-6-hydroxy-3-cyclohexene-1-carboxylic-acid synthase [Acidimicrobiales bacterium]